jgi:hypothetical protein
MFEKKPENENESIYERIRREAREKQEKLKKDAETRSRQLERLGITTGRGFVRL